MEGFLGNLDRVGTFNPEREEAATFLAAWRALGKEAMRVGEVALLPWAQEAAEYEAGAQEPPAARTASQSPE